MLAVITVPVITYVITRNRKALILGIRNVATTQTSMQYNSMHANALSDL